MKKILFVSHCILNTASKVAMDDRASIASEEDLRRRFVAEALSSGIQLIQLPCPEFTLYGSRRWGHVSNQFNNPFFREHCRRLIEPFILQIREYRSDKRKFRILGIVGIDGSPSCGVKYTCAGNWGGSYQTGEAWANRASGVSLVRRSGIFIQVLREMLEETGLSDIPVVGLYADEEERLFRLIREEK